ncbi:hypothetical protein [Vibrio vulnificus]|uniref:hypothetical protein n=1 Tax=Vibrio vulnificus TaxID=672 RepID=UPI000932C595|nr:hypothetical protein [Vibrio vulnificus]POB27470.1 hypothetical protein CRN47_03945 [Vibrio vulnificus]HAS6323091.1 hypothetical protein [Vibrio vulnificus]HDY7594636.1 hypothetical protein [Vibrio vulnificus]HDY8178612.1 hypothetical protein [Vibrio vulnificus]
MKKFVLFMLGVLLGAFISYFAVTKIITLRGSVGMHGFVNATADAIQNEDAVDLITCMKLAKYQGISVNHFALNSRLNNELQAYDNGTNRAFNVLIYVKGYGVGVADRASDKSGLFSQLKCVERFEGVIG